MEETGVADAEVVVVDNVYDERRTLNIRLEASTSFSSSISRRRTSV